MSTSQVSSPSDSGRPPQGGAFPAGLQPAASGTGPLIQRDYWAVVQSCRLSPAALIALVVERFCEFPPADMVIFQRCGSTLLPLQVGDEFDITIRVAGEAKVRVVHMDTCSFTLATLEGHPEAGRITFGAYRNDRGDVIFHIRSRARSASMASYLGFRSAGDPMQTSTWVDFVNSVALTCGEGVVGHIRADTQEFDGDDLDEGDVKMDRPAFVAKGD